MISMGRLMANFRLLPLKALRMMKPLYWYDIPSFIDRLNDLGKSSLLVWEQYSNRPE